MRGGHGHTGSLQGAELDTWGSGIPEMSLFTANHIGGFLIFHFKNHKIFQQTKFIKI